MKKMKKSKYGKHPMKKVETTPWAEVHINLIGSYTVKTQKADLTDILIKITLVAMIFINPITG